MNGCLSTHRYAVLGLLLILSLLVSGQSLAGPKIHAWQTGSGAKVLFVAAPEIPMLDVRVVFDAGSARDADKPGLMKLVNALLTQGAGDWDADTIAERVDGVGAQLGRGSLRDMAWVSMRSLTDPAYRGPALETLAAILGSPRFDGKDLERLRENMLVSLRSSEQSPGSQAKKAFYHAVYGQHPYASDMGGTRESLPDLTRDQVLEAYRRYYVANNALVAIVGALSREAAEAIAEQVTSGLRPGQAAPALPDVKPLDKALTTRRDFPSSQSHIYVGQPGMRRVDPDYFSLYVGNHILGGSGLVSILSDEVREQRGLSYSVYSYFLPMRRRGPYMMGLQTKNQQADEALQVMMDTLRRYVREGPSEEQLDAAKKNITGGFPLRIASNGKIIEYLAVIGFYDLPLDYLDTFSDKVNQVTVAKVRAAFQQRLDPERMVTIILGRGAERMAGVP